MTTAEQILVVFLSTALAVLLVIAIIAGVQAVRLLKTLRRIADKAEHLADSAEAVGDVFKHAASALSISKFVRGIVNFAHHKQAKDKKGE